MNPDQRKHGFCLGFLLCIGCWIRGSGMTIDLFNEKGIHHMGDHPLHHEGGEYCACHRQ